MSRADDTEAAFPYPLAPSHHGMSYREWLVGQALAGGVCRVTGIAIEDASTVAARAVAIADATIRVLRQNGGTP